MAGKKSRKQGPAKKDSASSFLKHAFINAIILSAVISVYYLIVRLMQAYSGIFYPLQVLEAKLVCLIQSPFTGVVQRGAVLFYRDFAVEVVWDCLGIRQSLFFLALVSSFYQVELKDRLRALWLVPLIIAANIARIAILYPLFLYAGPEKTAAAHEFFYSYGNGIFILLLFVAWFYVFVMEKGKQQRKG